MDSRPHRTQQRLFVPSSTASSTATSPVFKQPRITHTKERRHRRASKTLKHKNRTRSHPHRERGSSTASTWDFDAFIRSQYDDAQDAGDAAETRWHRCPGTLADAIMQLAEDASVSALPNVFREHETELLEATHGSRYEVTRIYQMKQKLLAEILRKMHSRLKDTSLPTTLRPQDLDVEAVVTKRTAIQQRYQEESRVAEKLAIELQRERERLEETRRVLKDLKGAAARKRHDKLVTGDIHPALLPAIQNAYGVSGLSQAPGTSPATSITPWRRDVAEMNLVIPEAQQRTSSSSNTQQEAALAIPALALYDTAERQIDGSLRNVLTTTHLPETAQFFSTFDNNTTPNTHPNTQ
ncbi:Okp1 protein [Maudiozyma humilis]|uniref:Okp1 protein n=1 Tax=Maudiozyma humilis TaxID=51915 RepID=A0AAV5RW75_MAUHU|nr:Okp1 protein [Kazachstania humilis]